MIKVLSQGGFLGYSQAAVQAPRKALIELKSIPRRGVDK